MKRITVSLCLAVALLGCQPIQPPAAPAAPDTAEDAPAPVASPADTQESTMTLQDALTNPVVDQAVADLAAQLNISADEIDIVSSEEITWPDGSLGCPEPGMMYAQVLQDGMRIVLSAGGVEYHYHSGGDRPPFLCENPVTP